MNVKLALLVAVFTVIALQESSAAWSRFRFRIPRIRWRRYIRVGPVGILPQTGGWYKGRDVARDIDENEDGFLDESELSEHLNERDLAELMEALDEDGDSKVSLDEFNDN